MLRSFLLLTVIVSVTDNYQHDISMYANVKASDLSFASSLKHTYYMTTKRSKQDVNERIYNLSHSKRNWPGNHSR